MKKIITFVALLCLGVVATGCKKSSSGEEPTVNPADYQLSTDKKKLVKWLNAETTSLNMQNDVNLREVTTIGSEAFLNHEKLTAIAFPDKLESIEEEAFNGAALSGELIIPINVKKIESEAFSRTKITSLIIKPTLVFTLEDAVFSQCHELKTVIFENGIVDLPKNTFHSCSSLEKVDFNNHLETVGNYAFSRCTNLKTINLAQVKSISEGAFALCMRLNSITIPFGNTNNITTLGSDVFMNLNPVPNIYVMPSLVNHYKTAEGWKNYADKIFPAP